MPKISITSLNREIFCIGKVQTVLSAIQESSIDWMHACGGKGRCTTCAMIILDGGQNLSELSRNELYYRDRMMLNENERLACQSTISDDIEICVPKSSRLPHVDYVD